MDILRALGVDWTLLVHLVCFGISYVFFTNLVLKPYAAALREREKRTVGNEEQAVRLVEEASKLQTTYELKAKALNAEIKGHYDKSRLEATAQYEKLVAGARAETTTLLKGVQANIEREIDSARKTLSSEIPAVGAAIASKLAGKEITV